MRLNLDQIKDILERAIFTYVQSFLGLLTASGMGVDMGGTVFTLVNSTLDSVSFSSSIGDTAATCNATFSVSIGGPNSSSRLDISGVTGPSS